MPESNSKPEIVPELKEAIQRLIETDYLSEDLKVIALKKAKEILDRYTTQTDNVKAERGNRC